MGSLATKSSGMIYTPAAQDTTKLAVLKIDGKDTTYIMCDSMVGSQGVRTQVDVALNGDVHIISAGKSMGYAKFALMDGPFVCAEAPDSILSLYPTLDKIESRKMSLTYKLNDSVSATFKGVIASLTTKVIEEQGRLYVATVVEANGVWG
jgi:hypothetical protein